MRLEKLELSTEDRKKLQDIVAKGSDWRMRGRAQTLLYFSDGLSAKTIATLQDLNLDTVYDRRKHWLAEGFSSLADKHRSGAPSKLNSSHLDAIKEWAKKEALTAPAILAKLREEFNVSVSVNTLVGALKKLKFVWKRTRHSLKKKRNEVEFRKSQLEINEMLAQAENGEIELAYVDEAGFAQAQPNRSAWTPVGETHAVDANRGKRLNVIGAMLSSGGLFTVKLWETTTALIFAGFLGLLMEHVGKPLTIILDNASVHKAKEIEFLLEELAQKGLRGNGTTLRK
ncbi:MAG: IS630 family transposase [Actinomycetota bacterium]